MSEGKWVRSCCVKALSVLPILSVLGFIADSAQAFSWQYARDAAGDSLDLSGGRSFDILGMGILDDGQNITIGISANMGIGGHNVDNNRVCSGSTCYPVPNGNIGWGDLFFDFTGNREFGTSNDNRQLFGVRFAPGNDSGVSLGVYRNVYGVGVQTSNAGYRNLGRHYNSLPTAHQQATTNVGDLAWNDTYWGGNGGRFTYSVNTESMPNVIASGERIGDVNLLDQNALLANGFSGNLGGSQLFGFQFARSLFPNGQFIATLLEECLNDAIALRGNLTPPPVVPPPPPPEPPATSVPEPSSIVALTTLGAFLAQKRFSKNANQQHNTV
jgi:hypothetical protein